MFIQIDGVGFVNKGAELMLCAIMDRLKKEDKLNSQFVFGAIKNRSDIDIRKSGMFQRFGLAPFLGKFLSRRKMNSWGFVKDKQIKAVLDASGFALGDQWENEKKSLKNRFSFFLSNYKLRNKKRILLPQAFGPFEKEASRKTMKIVYRYTDLLFARDKVSYDHLIELFGTSDKIKLAPDFTSIYKPSDDIILKKIYDDTRHSVVIIPNNKMISHSEHAAGYSTFILNLAKEILSKKKKVVFLNHQGIGDRMIIDEITSRLSKEGYDNFQILDGLDAMNVKAAIGFADFVISSRFHGVVSALTQEVPVLCTSWSHKYEELLSDYDYSDGFLNVADLKDAKQKINKMFDSKYLASVKAKLAKHGKTQRQLTNAMWDDVIEVLQK